MRRESFLCVLTSLVAVALCRSFISQTTTTTESDYDLNLDPFVEELNSRSDTDAPILNVTECETDKHQRGVCVTYYLCDEDKTIIEDGFSIIDLRIQSCPNFLDTCCLQSKVVSTAAPSRPPAIELDIMAPSTTGGIFDPSPEVTKSTSVTNPPSNPSPSSTGVKCGFSNPAANLFGLREGASTTDRVYADFGEFPWMVAVLRRSESEDWSNTDYIGGGSLIHPSVVMTVAHKLTRWTAHQIKIRAGEYDTNSQDEPYKHQERNVKKIVSHEHYFRRSLYNDIGLLFLETPVNLRDAPHIGVGCLAPQLPPSGTICFSMGWGAGNFANKKVFAAVLKKVKLPLLGKQKCEDDLKRTYLGKVFQLHNSLICAGGEDGVDTCRGDGGSSLVCPIDAKGSRFAIYGMVAYGIECGAKDVPGVYANIPHLYEWVGQALAKEGLDSNSYTYI